MLEAALTCVVVTLLSVGDVSWAADLAGRLLQESSPDRWSHSQAVARRADELEPILAADTDVVVAAAWLHDIGYAAELGATGFHPLDGARYLRENSIGDRTLWTLVAHHSCAVIEAEERGLSGALVEEFPVKEARLERLISALTWCDMSRGPQGQAMTVDERVTEAMGRYGPGDVVHRSLQRAAPLLRQQCGQIAAELGGA